MDTKRKEGEGRKGEANKPLRLPPFLFVSIRVHSWISPSRRFAFSPLSRFRVLTPGVCLSASCPVKKDAHPAFGTRDDLLEERVGLLRFRDVADEVVDAQLAGGDHAHDGL